MVQHIEIVGDKRSSKRAILSDLTFTKGDLIGDEDIEKSRQELMNRELYIDVLIEEIELEVKGTVKVRVVLKEKWSYLPLPILVRTSDGETRTGFSYEDFNFRGRAFYLKTRWLNKWADDYDQYVGEDYKLELKTHDYFRKGSSFSFSLTSGVTLERTYLDGKEISRYKESTDAYSMSAGRSFGDMNAGVSYSFGRSSYKHLEGEKNDSYTGENISSFGVFWGIDTVNNLGSYIYEGYTVHLNVSEANEAIGSDVDATTYTIDLKQFIHPGGKHNLAYRIRGEFVDGDASQGVKVSVGGSTSIRGYEKGEYEGDRTLQLNSEYRFPVTERYWGGVLFLDGGYAWPEGAAMRAEDMKWGAGLGLRLFIKRLVKGVGRIDYAYNLSRHESIAYAGVKHTF